MSYLCKPDLSSDSISGITLVAGFIIAKSIRDYCSIHQINDISVNLKWPNDIIINRKKVCGILTELCSVPSGPDSYNSYVICGIGINVNTAGFDEELSDKATSLYIESGQSFDREELVILIITKLKEFIRKYEESKDLGFIIDEYNDMLINMNKEVILNTRGIENTGERYISRGIDKTGALIVEDSCGNIKYVSSGEVSVRGVYGYV
jgi:BirA family biotin operon repressor/biotin-[acetyl-CoA-carboxylase] ligase